MTDLYAFAEGHSGSRRYVSVRGHAKSVPAYKTYKGSDGYNYILPEYGGDWSGYEHYSTAVEMPMYIRDISEYTSPIDGSRITSRSGHREHLRTHDVIEVGNERMPKAAPDTAVVDKRTTVERVKAHLESVRAMPQRDYDERVAIQEAVKQSALVPGEDITIWQG